MRNKFREVICSFALSFILMIPSAVMARPRVHSYSTKPGYKLQDLTRYANPFCGTAGDGNTYPGATAPFGMIQWSPDAGNKPVWGGYNYKYSTIYDFSMNQLNGAGCVYAGDFGFMPVLSGGLSAAPADRYAFSTPFSHANESAEPGYYSVRLGNGIRVQLTATTRTGFGRFTYPGNGPATMIVDAASDQNPVSLSFIRIDPATRSISGAEVSGHFCRKRDETTIYFYAVFSRPFSEYGTWSGHTLSRGSTQGDGNFSGCYLTFSLSGNRTVLVKAAISYVSIADAKENVDVENPVSRFSSRDFNSAVAHEQAVWNGWLNRIQVSGGTTAELKTFYSMLYHTLLGPTVCSDVNGKYIGYDQKIHETHNGRVQYADFSGWDIYRSECQLLAMIAPRHASDMAQSLLMDYEQGGTFPRWGIPNMDSGEMMGDPAAPMIADFYAFGARDFDVKAALAGLVKAATDPRVHAPRSQTFERDALGDYLKLGYVPEHQKGGYGNVSMTLEYNTDDFAVSRLAKALGDNSESQLLLKHAQYWKNLYNPETGYIQMRRRDGKWAPGFSDSVGRYNGDLAYVEGTGGQYLWAVPFNLKGLADKMGGLKIAAARLDTFFTKLNAGTRSRYAYLGNEPCLETPWEYDFFGEPYKTQEIVREAMTQLFSWKPLGYPGNDDLGEMSSWYVFGALGMYPELPGSDILVFGSPMFTKAVVHLKSGNVVIEGDGSASDAPYVQSLEVNGKKWDRTWIRFSDISNGGKLIFKLGSVPNKAWGAEPQDAPPSYQ